MPTYTFLLFGTDDAAISLDAAVLDRDSATIARARKLLADHQSCDHLEVWDGDRPVMARRREQLTNCSGWAPAPAG